MHIQIKKPLSNDIKLNDLVTLALIDKYMYEKSAISNMMVFIGMLRV